MKHYEQGHVFFFFAYCVTLVYGPPIPVGFVNHLFVEKALMLADNEARP